jgi:predicted Zn-dependent peptidase
MAQESMSSRMNRLGKSEVYFNRIVPLQEVVDAINAVTADDIVRVAERIFPASSDDLTVAAVGPIKKPRAAAASRNGAAAAARPARAKKVVAAS